MIVLTTTAHALGDVVEQVTEQRRWIDGVELRVDLLRRDERNLVPRLPELLASRGLGELPLICTVRRERDGGRSVDSDADRLLVLRAAIDGGFSGVDLESDLGPSERHRELLDAAARDGRTVIRSFHDFERVPADLPGLVRGLPQRPGELPKAAVMPRSTADLLELVRSARLLAAQPHIVLGMGEHGLVTRLLPAHLGNALTFASPPGSSAAPGHLPPQELAESYGVRRQTADTPVFAVIGSPIGHSRSPSYHNARFAEDGIDAVYVPVLVDELDAFVALADELTVLGVSVTIPHKQSVIHYLSEIGEDVRAAGACNTMVRLPEGWKGVNTDVIGFLAPLDEVLSVALSGTRVLVLGAGGAARGVVYALLARGAQVVIWNRTTTRAASLVEELRAFEGESTVSLLEATEGEFEPVDVVVNTTSSGMHCEGDPALWYEFSGHEVVYDIVYTPPETPFIQRAAAAGCRIITGDRMFRAQAAAQYELYRTLATGGSADA
jgi:3-dehydroquinate dehydratase / shikimate dehydrogenase